MKSKRSHEGYFQIDHRYSPGTTAVPEGAMFESAAYTCSHCNYVVIIHPERTRARAYCTQCDRYICDACGFQLTTTGCRNLNKLLDKLQEEAFRQTETGL